MKLKVLFCAAAFVAVAAQSGSADDFEQRIVGGSAQLGGEIVISVTSGDKTVPSGAVCDIELPAPYSSHVDVISSDCGRMVLQQKHEPIIDDTGYALPSTQVPYELVVRTGDGSEVGRISGTYPYNNQFSDLRILIKDVRNPVSPGQSFEAVVLGAGEPIAESLLCRWNVYGPVTFEPTSDNECVGRLTAQPSDGRDADVDVEIVNLTDMHAVGYAIAKMIVR